MKELWHGTPNGYTHHKCRCTTCRYAIKAYGLKYRIDNPEKIKARNDKNHAANSARETAQRAQHRVDNPGLNARWQKDNPDKIRTNKANRRARKLNQFDESVSKSVLWERDKGICHICHLSTDINDWHLDHIIPLSKGGRHSYKNTAVSHPFCNQSKGTKIAEYLKKGIL